MTANARLASLDVFRGVTIAAMIVVNNPGNWNAVFPPLAHAAWHGCTPADLVFPFFIVIMGLALPLAFARRRGTAGGDGPIVRHVWTRAATLVAMGLFLNAVAQPHPALVRIPGVLQRIGLTYLVSALIVLRARPIRWPAIAALLLIAHWALLLLPFDGRSAGSLGPLHNVASAVDLRIFGAHTLTASGDPEGLLGLLSSIATALIGAGAGWWLRREHAVRTRVAGLLAGGGVLALAGLTWSAILPLNKALWTGSYALFSAGLALLAFGVCYLVVDVRGRGRWARPFVWLGRHPLAIYFGSELLGRLLDMPVLAHSATHASVKELVFWSGLAPLVGDAGGAWSSSLFAAAYATLWVLVAGLVERRRAAAPKGGRSEHTSSAAATE